MTSIVNRLARTALHPVKIGYLVPEFPGQTHAFFWREIQALRECGVEVALLSTRRPSWEIISHSWSAEAMNRTTYLFPMGLGQLGAAMREWLRAGPRGWARCLAAIGAAEATVRYKIKMMGLMLAGAELAGVARRQGWRHVHVHSCANAAMVAMFAKLLAGVDYSLTLHGALETYGPAMRDKWSSARFGIAVSRQLRTALEREVGVAPEKLETASMGVDLDRFRRRKAYVPAAGGKRRIVSCGRLHAGKGHQDVIAAVAELRAGGMDVELTILGEGPAHGDLERLIRKLGAESYVRLAGAVSEHVVCDELERADVFMLGSHNEAIGVAIMEAMAMGLPVVVTDVDGVPELVRDGVDGILVSAKDIGAMAAGLRRVLGDAELATRLGRAGERRVREFFHSRVSATAIARRLGVIAGDVLSEGKHLAA